MKEAPSDERKGPLTWVDTRGIEPRTSCLQTRGGALHRVAGRKLATRTGGDQ
jgi:hypothetical protein